MAVLMEAISVVIRVETIQGKFPGGMSAFLAVVPNKTYCSDGELARVSFMVPQDVGAFVDRLESSGLRFLRAGSAADLAVVDQRSGPTTPCAWLEFGHVNLSAGGNRVAASRLKGSRSKQIATPPDWTYENSLSASHTFVANEDISARLEFLRTENGIDVYLDKTTGKEVYAGRTRGA